MRSSPRLFPIPAAALAAVVSFCVLTSAQSPRIKTWPPPDSSNFRPAEQITSQNVGELKLAWSHPYGAAIFSPVFARDVLYGFGRNNTSIIALDAATGKEIWVHDGLSGINAKGMNYWESDDGSDRRLIFSVNSFLQEIDARTGKTIPTFGIDGAVDLRKGLLRAEGTGLGVQPASPGRIWKNTIILGGQAGESIMTPPGDIRGYDVLTGKLAWQFNTVPQPGQDRYETNPPDGWKYIGGANNWGEMALDDGRGIVYLTTGSATADFWGGDRHGQNLFANCLLALDARTGRRLWHFQTVHHDLWDLDNVSAPQLVTVTHSGQKVDVVAHAGKTGFLYVFNRVTGEPLWPIEERAVGRSDVPNELSWPTQPFPTKPPAFARQSFTADDINPNLLTKAEYDALTARMASALFGTGSQGGLFNRTAIDRTSVSMPGNQGGSNWGTTAADPERGLVFVTGVNQVALLVINDVKDPAAGGRRGGGNQIVRRAVRRSARVPAGPRRVPRRGPARRDSGRALSCGVPRSRGGPADDLSEGHNTMRAVVNATNEEIAAMYSWLEQTNPVGRSSAAARGGRGGAPLPPGPVVASGGAPHPPLPPRYMGPYYPGVGGTAGNAPWPDDVEAARLPTRYQSGYNVMATSTRPPYTTITAYDLNTGEIKWQVPNGDDPQTVQMTTAVPGTPCLAAGGCVPGGVHDTGGVGARYGMVVTKSGLLFQLGKDGFARAYDVDTGKVLWKGAVAGAERGIPVVYASKGREYVLFMSPAAGAGQEPGAAGGGGAPMPAGPYGYLAFALPGR